MSYELIKFEIEDGVGKIALNRPDVLNSFNRQMAFETQDALDKCIENSDIRAVFLTGEGRAFCAGQDLVEAISEDGPSIEKIVREHYNPIIQKIRNIEKPVICAVNGVAAGAGANLAISCDITFAGESVSFIQSFSNISLIPDSGGTFFLPRLVGMQKATALMMLAEKVKAPQAAELGMIYKSCSDDSLIEEALNTAKKLAKMPTKGFGYTKRALNKSLSSNLDSQLDFEVELQKKAASTYDYNEGVNAFLEKRKPEFKGA
jgi:2-(1,2-epoxy-1,2-dihydrophenyl)acetyl-CoA isomerase